MSMKTVNALTIRNELGKVLDALERSGEPVLVSKGRKVRAVLITPSDFKTRFLDRQAEEARAQLVASIAKLRADALEERDSVDVLRELRGYGT
jgi:PHD/YefM family antitoxin component YafN of YafNO toxin-antitoxin module